MKGCLVYPEKGFERRPDDRQEQAGKEPAYDLGVDVMFAGLPVGIYPQTAQYAADGAEYQHHVRKAEIPAVHFTAGLVKLPDARRRLGHA